MQGKKQDWLDLAGLAVRLVSLSRFNPTTGCVEFTGGGDRYGRIGGPGHAMFLPNRVALALSTGECPADRMAAHKCNNPPCVNPNHLYWATRSENELDKSEVGRAHKKYPQRILPYTVRGWIKSGERPCELSKQTGISSSTISAAIRRERKRLEQVSENR